MEYLMGSLFQNLLLKGHLGKYEHRKGKKFYKRSYIALTTKCMATLMLQTYFPDIIGR